MEISKTTAETGGGMEDRQGASPVPAGRAAPAKKGAGTKTVAKKRAAGSGTGKTAAARVAAGRQETGKHPDLERELRDFASGRPQGWDHGDWEAFLGYLRERGHDTSNADAIGLELERERLALALRRVEGVGPQRVRALTDRYATIWNLRNADVEEIASVARIRRDLAERIKTSV